MKINITTKAIRSAALLVNNYTSKNGETVGQVVIEGKKGMLSISTTDFVESISIKEIPFTCSDMTLDSFETFSVDGKKLVRVLKAAKGDAVSIELNNGHILVISGGSKIKLETFAKTQKVSFEVQEDEINLTISDTLTVKMQEVFHAIDQGNSKPCLNGALLQVKGKTMSLVSTDTRRLAIAALEQVSTQDFEIVIPRQGINSICKLFAEKGLTAAISENILNIRASNLQYSVKLVNDTFPDWKRIIPSNFSQTAEIKKETLGELVAEASIFNDEISLIFKDGELVIKDADGNTEVRGEIGNERNSLHLDISFSINAKIILDFITASSSENITIHFNAANLPLKIEGDGGYEEICMPIIAGITQSKDNSGAKAA